MSKRVNEEPEKNNTPNRIVLTLYLCLILVAYLFVFVTDNTTHVVIVLFVFSIVVYSVSGKILEWINSLIVIRCDERSRMLRSGGIKCFALYSIVSFLIMIVWFIGFRPGSYQPDCISQFTQALNGNYSNWHPVLQTLFTYTIPLRLTHGAVWSPVFFQLVFFSLSVGYVCEAIQSYFNLKWSILSFLYIVLNPFTAQMMLYPWKDASFALMGMISVVMTFKIYMTESEWSKKWWRCILLSFALGCTSIFRHNGVLFSVPLLMALMFFMKRRQWVVTVLSFLTFMIVIKVGVYSALDVSRDPQSVVQHVGLPLTIIGNVVCETPELMDDELSDFVYRVAPQEVWESEYQLGNFGVMKYYAPIDSQTIEDEGSWSITKMGIRCFALSPKASLKAFFALTDIVYGVDISDEGYIGTQIVDNDLGLVYKGNQNVAHILDVYYKLVRMHGYNFLRQSAFSLLLMLAVTLSVCDMHSWRGWKMVILVLPIFMYSFGTMLLLTDPTSRFFFIGYMVCPVYLAMLSYEAGKSFDLTQIK